MLHYLIRHCYLQTELQTLDWTNPIQMYYKKRCVMYHHHCNIKGATWTPQNGRIYMITFCKYYCENNFYNHVKRQVTYGDIFNGIDLYRRYIYAELLTNIFVHIRHNEWQELVKEKWCIVNNNYYLRYSLFRDCFSLMLYIGLAVRG